MRLAMLLFMKGRAGPLGRAARRCSHALGTRAVIAAGSACGMGVRAQEVNTTHAQSLIYSPKLAKKSSSSAPAPLRV